MIERTNGVFKLINNIVYQLSICFCPFIHILRMLWCNKEQQDQFLATIISWVTAVIGTKWTTLITPFCPSFTVHWAMQVRWSDEPLIREEGSVLACFPALLVLPSSQHATRRDEVYFIVCLFSWIIQDLPNRPFHNFGASKSVLRHFLSSQKLPISWSRGSKFVKEPVG